MRGSGSHPVPLPLPGWRHHLCLPLFFPAAGVLKGARCGSESHGREELGEGELRCWEYAKLYSVSSKGYPVGRGPPGSLYLPVGS